MSQQYPGGFITKSPVAPTSSAASGIWTVDQAMQYIKAGNWPLQPVNYIEDVFSTYMYSGTGSALTITNGVNLSTYGGLVWIKSRSAANSHCLFDTTRGALQFLESNTANINQTQTQSLTSFDTTGFTLGTTASISVNVTGQRYISWTPRKQPKFFDIVTYTGNGASVQAISHNLGSTPGCILIKRTDTTENWCVFHRGTGSGNAWTAMSLNSTSAGSQGTPQSTVTSTTFDPANIWGAGSSPAVANTNGGTFVAYLFAHDAGGFGLTGSDNVISCGSYTGNGSTTGPIVTLGYEPQWLLVKNASASANWALIDNMRGFPVAGSNQSTLLADSSAAELINTTYQIQPTSTGFQPISTNGLVNANTNTYIYIAIRRGPMKVPTSGTSVFAPVTYTGNATSNRAVSVGFPVDFALVKNRTSVVYNATRDRLVGSALFINASSTGSTNATNNFGFTGPLQDTHYIPESGSAWNASANNYILEAFKRAPSFMDIVCYTGTGTARALTHNLTVAPELIFVVSRSLSQDWNVYAQPLGNTNYLVSNLTDPYGTSSTRWNNTSPTATQFTVGTQATVNSSGATYVAYLFATCAGVSKVGSYTGTGALQTINCGFTSGARFVMIKYADGVGDWYYWDSARGISSGNDPYLGINSTAAETTGTNYVDTDTTGFKVTAAAPAELNSVGGTYIFLAIS